MYLLEETIVTPGGVVMDGSNIPHFRYCGPSHSIANPFLSLTSHIQKIWTKTSQIQQKLCNLCILYVLNHDISQQRCHFHNICWSYWVFRRVGDWQFFRFDYLYVSCLKSPETYFESPPPRCVWPGRGRAYCVTSHQIRNHNHQASSIRKQLLPVILR